MAIRKYLSKTELDDYIHKAEPLKKAFDLVADHVIITDQNANIVYANKVVEKNTGFAIEEVIGKNPADLWAGHMPDDFYRKMWQQIKIEKKPFVGEVKNTKKDGTEYWQELHISPVLDDKEEILFFVGVEPNITDRKKKEQFREEFISIIGHQVRDPLSAIRWTLDWLNQNDGFTEKQRKALDELYSRSSSMAALINDLLLLARMENALKSEKVDMVSEISDIIKSLKTKFKEIVFVFDAKEKEFIVEINKSLSMQAFYNIIANAAEYANKKEGRVEISIGKASDFYVFACKDNGIGIPEEDKNKIFSRFFRASNAGDAKKGGTGLGLFIVKMIADNFGWEVSFESKVGVGTVFFVKIPLRK